MLYLSNLDKNIGSHNENMYYVDRVYLYHGRTQALNWGGSSWHEVELIVRPSFKSVFNGRHKFTCDIRGAKPRAVCLCTQPFRGSGGIPP